MNVDLPYLPNRQLFKLNVCRLCSLIRDKVLPIFDNAGSKVDVKIKECFPNIEIKKDDLKPQHICIDCITKLNMFNEFLQICVESENKFDNYVKQYLQQNIFKSAVLHNSIENPSLWQEDIGKVQESQSLPNEDGVIVLSKMDSVLRDPSAQDFVLMVELKYKDKMATNVPYTNPKYNVNNASLDTNINHEATNYRQLTDLNGGDGLTLQYSHENIQPQQQQQQQQQKENSNNQRSKDKQNYVCAVCGHSFTRRTRLNSHMSRHTSIKPHKCDKCDKAFAMRWDLTAHKRVHTQAFVCHSCNKSFGSKSKLVRHSRVHTGERPFVCPDCGKSFGEKRNLENHVRAHTGDKPYSCTTCGKAFGVKSHLKDHLSVHNKTPRFACTLCSKSFKWKTNYNRHIRSHGTSSAQY